MTPQTQTVWPRRMPAFQMLGFVLAVAVGFVAAHMWFDRLPLVQAFYLRGYVWQEIVGGIPSIQVPGRKKQSDIQPEAVLYDGYRPAVVTIRALDVRIMAISKAGFHAWLKQWVYRDRSLLSIFRWPLIVFGLALVSFLTAGGILDRRFNSRARNGQRLRGPEVVSRWKFNRSV